MTKTYAACQWRHGKNVAHIVTAVQRAYGWKVGPKERKYDLIQKCILYTKFGMSSTVLYVGWIFKV